MPTAVCDGIETRYEVTGSGEPLLMFSPGGFNATIENWSEFGIYRRLQLLRRLSGHYMCIAFDKRESGESGGRVERITWDGYAAQGAGLLDHLGIERAALLGGCVGCSIVVAFATSRPERVSRLVLYSPAGGPRYRLKQRARFDQHLSFVAEEGLGAAVALARSGDDSFSQDPRVGPWASVIRTDAEFADEYARWDAERYRVIVADMAATLFDRDTVAGAEAEQLLQLGLPALVVPGDDENHAVSAARYLHECLSGSEYWDVPPDAQGEENAPPRILQFLSSDSPRSSAAI
ncbi:MAG: alpha/beta fold hydrolase [Gaiellaceae bacterium]